MTQPMGSGIAPLGESMENIPIPTIGEPQLAGQNPDGVFDYLFANNIALANGNIIIPSGGPVIASSIVTPVIYGPTNTLEVRNGPNIQMLNVYSTYTDVNNWERLNIYAAGASGTFIRMQKTGTGVDRPLTFTAGTALYIGGNNTQEWVYPGNLSYNPVNNNTQDIGNNGQKVRQVYVGTAVSTGGKAGVAVDGDVVNPSDGMMRYDSTNNRFYIRIAGVWKYAALT